MNNICHWKMSMHRNVMVIDDSLLECFLAERIIKNSLFTDEVMTFSSPVDGLLYLESLGNDLDKFPEVIFLDIYMPLMNGFDFMDKFLQFHDEIKKHCKIVMVSSSMAYEDQVRMRRYPIIRKFLTKPLSEEMLEDLSRLRILT